MARVWDAADTKAAQQWSRQDQALEDCLALNAYLGPKAQGFIQTWLLLLPVPWGSAQKAVEALDLQQLQGEAQLRPRPGVRAPVGSEGLLWQEHRLAETFARQEVEQRTSETVDGSLR
jgi:hypothetical protein